MVDTLYVVWLN